MDESVFQGHRRSKGLKPADSRERCSFPGKAEQRYSLITDVTRACLQGGDFPRRFRFELKNERPRQPWRDRKKEMEVGVADTMALK